MFWEKTLNPQFFAYGSFWNYIVLFLLKVFSFIPNYSFFPSDPFSRAIVILRVFSAIQGVGVIIVSYFVGKTFLRKMQSAKFKVQNDSVKFKIKEQFIKNNLVLVLPFLIATSPGLIQAAHFGTFESSLTFLYFLIFYLCLKALSKRTRSTFLYILAVIFFGVSISIRVTSLVLLPVLFFLIIFINKKSLISFKFLFSFAALLFIPAIIFIVSNPYAVNWALLKNNSSLFSSDFLSTMNYESSVARGTLPVFYTQQFQQTTPIVYQFVKVLPYVLNPLIYIFFLFAIMYFFVKVIQNVNLKMQNDNAKLKIKKLFNNLAIKQYNNRLLLLTCLFFLLIFVPNSILYVKWTRYIIPSLPYIYIFVFLLLLKVNRKLIFVVSVVSLILGIFFTSVYSFDTRIEAAAWAKKNLKPSAKILSEIYDMGIVPFNEVFNYSQIKLFNFYDTDDTFSDTTEMIYLDNLTQEADAIVLPSRRIAATKLRLPRKYPNGFLFYDRLLHGKSGFKQAADFFHPYDRIVPFTTPDESFTVFDHPEVTIFMK